MLTSGLRLRRPFKYLLATLVVGAWATYALRCFTNDMPLLSDKLPKYSGTFAVGTIDLEVPVETRKINASILKETGQPAFQLETVLFSLYYPAVKKAKSQKPKHRWIADNSLFGTGYARFARVSNGVTDKVFAAALWSLTGSTTIPAAVDVPIEGTAHLHQDSNLEQSTGNNGRPRFPVIIFSHGMASSRTSYTQLCGELASRGYVVAAIEHRDGSCPATTVMRKDGTTQNVFHITESQLEPRPEIGDLKVMQLAMREAEVEETVRVLGLLNSGFGQDVFNLNTRKEGTDLAEWIDRLDMNRIVMAGHSYGATGALQALRDAPSERHPFIGGIIMDPGKESGPLNNMISVPLLVVNSQSWSARHSVFFGRPHFEVVKDLVSKALEENKGKFAWFVTSKGTSHPSVTDAPLIEPTILSWTTGSSIDTREALLQYVKISQEFMLYLEDGHRRGILDQDMTHTSYDVDVRSDERMNNMPQDIAKYWQIHVAPSTECPSPGLRGVVPK